MKILKIEENDAGGRLDKFLKKLFPRASRSLIYKFNRKSKIKVQRQDTEGFKKRDNEFKLETGDQVKIFLSDKDFAELQAEDTATKKLPLGDFFDKKDIVFEDASLFVVNKNPGINVHSGDHKTKETNLIAQVQDYLGEKLNSLTFKPSLIHRIDRDTSGIILIAKKKDILQKLTADFKNHKKVTKVYYTLVLGKMSRPTGTIKKKLKRIENAKNENKVQVSNDGKEAITHYEVLAEHKLQTKEGSLTISELEVGIETGRMHQIRVHLSSLGNPILGDKTYGDKKLNAFFANNFGLKRQALHAWKIDFFHYGRKKSLHLEAKIKKDLEDFLKHIKK